MTEKEEKKLVYEREYLEKGYSFIAGVDEVGRGPLAGPVVCAAVIMPLKEEDIIEGVDDSKKLSAKKREKLSEEILKKAIAVSICRVEPKEIDEINILKATKKCMATAVKSLEKVPDAVFVDALKIECGKALCVSIIKGDALSYSIGCASIVAKVYRDKLMDEYAEKYPEYAFEKNKGYGTAAHIKAIKEIGPCEIHRRSFIKNFWAEKAN
ncbi:MAG: ribonuclease HII [Candidatus Borkfalkiaceae bacterium]|nr:ribonuclease HII [Christensenellaceae bacterium]